MYIYQCMMFNLQYILSMMIAVTVTNLILNCYVYKLQARSNQGIIIEVCSDVCKFAQNICL